ncbi:hypothetical protein N7475_003167 [Penicillium sp. IBT 31633x]|nr:hypothetical protein N7475_003167 [Penicillium sp. IBT 31633x]
MHHPHPQYAHPAQYEWQTWFENVAQCTRASDDLGKICAQVYTVRLDSVSSVHAPAQGPALALGSSLVGSGSGFIVHDTCSSG